MPGRAEICAEMARAKNRHFTAMYVSAAQQTCNAVAEAFKSFRQLLKLWRHGELAEKPKPPKYRSCGLFAVTYPRRWLKLSGQFTTPENPASSNCPSQDGIRIPLGNKVKAWFGIDSICLPMPSNLNFTTIKEVRILPRNGCFYAEFVYPVKTAAPVVVDPTKVMGIDHGINNWLTCVTNVGTSFIVDGRHLKSLNQWYNKRIATIEKDKPQGFWSNRLAAIAEKRNRQMRDAVNKAARLVIDRYLEQRIGRIVFGWNQRQKDSANLGRKTNQKFVQIPTARLKDRIAQMC